MIDEFHVQVRVKTSQGVLEWCWITSQVRDSNGSFLKATFSKAEVAGFCGPNFKVFRKELLTQSQKE